MADQLLDYMVKMSEDPDLMAKHNSDPEKAARDFGLNEQDIALVASGDAVAIKQRCSKDGTPVVPTDIWTFHTPM